MITLFGEKDLCLEVQTRRRLASRRILKCEPLPGLWQVSGRNRLPFDEMVRMDLYYIENWSLLLDIKIILQTLPVMWRGEAY